MEYVDFELVKEYLKIDFEPWVLSEDQIYNLIKLNNLEDLK